MSGGVPVFTVDGRLAPDQLRGYVASALPAALPTRRWFGDKSRPITSVQIDDLVELGASSDRWLVIARVAFTDGTPSRYLIPLTLAPGEWTDALCVFQTGTERHSLVDGLEDPAVRSWLLSVALSEASLPTLAGGTIRGEPPPKWLPRRLADSDSRVLSADQSNSAIVFGDTVLMKLFRKVQPGPNPDAELVRFLSGKGGFTQVPRYAASLEYRDPDGALSVLALAQEFVSGAVDAWTAVINALAQRLDDIDETRLIADGQSLGHTLGHITARMHLALASDPWSPDLAPEPITVADTERWSTDYTRMLDRMLDGLRSFHPTAGDARTSELVSACLQVAPGLHRRTNGFRLLTGREKTRVHGDFHLGQMLRRADGEFIVLDFEGEPARPVAERRRKTSPLKDVAGMLRSFGYARGTMTARLDAGGALSAAALVAWEREVRAAFLDAYVTVARAGGARFLPSSRGDLDAALAAWELDKATYEVVYELNNRPGWLWIPLTAMIKHGEPGRSTDV